MFRVLVAADSYPEARRLMALLGTDPGLLALGPATDPARAAGLAADAVLVEPTGPLAGRLANVAAWASLGPTPIVVVGGGDPGFDDRARRLGASAVVALPPPSGPGRGRAAAELLRARRALARASGSRAVDPFAQSAPRRRPAVVAVGCSTGGPSALDRLLSALSPDLRAPILVVQHLSPGFAPAMVRWLEGRSTRPVRMAAEGVIAAESSVLLAPDGAHLGVTASGRVRLSDLPPIGGFRPSATHLFGSVAAAFGASAAAVVLSGMGDDGLEGLRAVREAGGLVLAQDEASSVVFGMPGVAVAGGMVDFVGTPERIAARLAAPG